MMNVVTVGCDKVGINDRFARDSIIFVVVSRHSHFYFSLPNSLKNTTFQLQCLTSTTADNVLSLILINKNTRKIFLSFLSVSG